ncbi:PREDICTED: uncharacterized protein LOC107170048 [Diuraphis noxia]|uniref:uncharacterized protein LOC107170048 n=1 Tax=Diuraphis noxia TaxID=143948 RepID=UPI00076366EE|nr:PREDICTED: uncharacterized protein LOC107170048 [Diuraphis noxia]
MSPFEEITVNGLLTSQIVVPIIGDVLKKCKLIVWDESPMSHKKGFGGVTVLLAGDFRQTLPIVSSGTQANEIAASLHDFSHSENLSPSKLCNETRLWTIGLQRNLIEAIIMTGSAKGESILIPRIPIIPSDYPFQFKRVQFPVKVCFAMTTNKSQG